MKFKLSVAAFAIAALLIGTLSIGALFLAAPVMAAEPVEAAAGSGALQWAFMAGAASAGLSALAAGYAVAHVGSAGIGALAEKPDLFGRIVILVGLAEGIAIYGLIVAILIFNRVA